MIDINLIRTQPELVKAAVKNKNEKADISRILQLDQQYRDVLKEVEALRSQKNTASEEIGRLKKEKKDASEILAKMKSIAERQKTLENSLEPIKTSLDELLKWVPNIPDNDVPAGPDASGNQLVKTYGEKKVFDFAPKPHYDIAENLGLADFKRAAKIAGASFILFTGHGAMLERALINFMLDLHVHQHKYTEISPPYLANPACMFGTGQLPKLEEDMYKIPKDEFYLNPTAEVPLTNIHRDEILDLNQLPIYYTAYTACFRREAGAYGKDTRGFVRVHQFDKVELVKFAHPEKSAEEHEKLLADAEEVLQMLGLHYRVVKLCTGDMSFASAKTYDIELWAPGMDRWLEVSSCSNFRDFQARRANIRFRDQDGKVKFAHTLNGSGVALPRLVIAILENCQQKDGSVKLPELLAPYTNGIIEFKS
ncbi:MAG: serine--tRNA ligase [Planctomycetes bacterium]|nr:serine--tRNA ligase [Planctomycetota bacterium]